MPPDATKELYLSCEQVMAQYNSEVFHPDLVGKEYLVELAVIDDPSITIIEVVEARNQIEAAYFAFYRRNVATSWKITAIEE